jgi:MinD superfamily P-loop ATPase
LREILRETNRIKYKQIVVLSGKGGTGKTTIASALSCIAEDKMIIDADVDAANLHLVFIHQIISEYDYFGGRKAEIIPDNCSHCGLCEQLCRFDAIKEYVIDRMSCEGCGFCFHACPDNAISFYETKSGIYSECQLEDKAKFYYAKLLPGEGNSGKLVSELKRKAEKQIKDNIKWVIIDGPPGIGCPVNASLSGVDFAVLVAEPTQSGLHDLKRVINLLKIFKIPSGVIINKCNINDEMSNQIEKHIVSQGIKLLAKIPFDRKFIEAIQNSRSVTEYEYSYKRTFNSIWNDIHNSLSK